MQGEALEGRGSWSLLSLYIALLVWLREHPFFPPAAVTAKEQLCALRSFTPRTALVQVRQPGQVCSYTLGGPGELDFSAGSDFFKCKCKKMKSHPLYLQVCPPQTL